MRFKRKISWTGCLLLVLLSGSAWWSAEHHLPVLQRTLSDNRFGKIAVARPLIFYRDLVVVFADTAHFQAADLAYRIAREGAAVAVLDSGRAFQALADGPGRCLDAGRIGESREALSNWAHAATDEPLILAGIGDGGLLSFLSAGTADSRVSRCLSVGFSVQLPDGCVPCPPAAAVMTDGRRVLASSPALNGKWLGVWTDQPDDATAAFIRGIAGAATEIAPYDTPPDSVAVSEIRKMITAGDDAPSLAVPVVEISSRTPNPTVTLFYSGDGGWRDLDRDVAGQLADLGYPVVGVDTLRYFWSRKTPEQAARDLAEMMARYRNAWGAKTFVLAGFSFGADVLPAIYNHLPAADREKVSLLVLLALSKTVDFEIHVSGWLGKNSGDIPVSPALNQIPGQKILCIIGQDELADSACETLSSANARRIVLPGGHHFDRDYPKLAKRIIEIYRQAGL